jgi:hypothetical protein
MANGFGTSPLELLASDAMLGGLIYCETFVYSASWIAGTATALAANGTLEVDIQINGDSDFVCQDLNLTTLSSATPPVLIPGQPMLLTITRAGSGRQLVNQAQNIFNLTGSFQSNFVPSRLPFPFLCQASNIIACTLQNLSNVAPGRVDLSLVGFKVFYTSNQVNRQSVFHVL